MISIIIPVYNAQDYIEDCVRSIIRQGYQDWELLLIENGSQDKSLEICKSLAKSEGRIRLFHEREDLGVSAARNLGMDEARGDYLTFVDADDWIKRDYLEVLVGLQKKEQADMVVCGYEKRYPEDRKRRIKPEEGARSETEDIPDGRKKHREGRRSEEAMAVCHTRASYVETCLLEGNTHCWGVLYSRKLVEKIRFPYGLSIGEDLLFLIDTALEAEKIVVSDYLGYQYFINAKGAMEKPFTLSYMDQILCWQQALDKLVKLYPSLKLKVESILLVSVLLVVGKLARLPRKEQKKYRNEQKYCSLLVKEYSRQTGIFSYLPEGYSLKVRFYRYFPGLYLRAYGRWKA